MTPAKLLFVAIGLSAAINVRGQSPTDEVDVYRLALRAAIPAESLSEGRLALMNKTTTDFADSWRRYDKLKVEEPNGYHPRDRLKYANPETVEAFIAANATSSPLPRELAALKEFALVDETHLNAEVAALGNWQTLARRYRVVHRRQVYVSRIGFGAAGSQALIDVIFVCGSLCGSARLVLLERGPTGWQVIKVDEHSVF